jgi:hypothetical protein
MMAALDKIDSPGGRGRPWRWDGGSCRSSGVCAPRPSRRAGRAGRLGGGNRRRWIVDGPGCGRWVGRRWQGGRSGSGSGRRSLAAWQARTRPPKRGSLRRSASGGCARVAGCHRSACGRRRAATCRSVSVKRSRCFAGAARECGRSRGDFGGRRRRSRGSCGGTPRPAAVGSSTAPRRRSRTPTGGLVGRSRPSWQRTRRCGGTCRSGSRGRSPPQAVRTSLDPGCAGSAAATVGARIGAGRSRRAPSRSRTGSRSSSR